MTSKKPVKQSTEEISDDEAFDMASAFGNQEKFQAVQKKIEERKLPNNTRNMDTDEEILDFLLEDQ